jgi:ribose/xylose/arabinose/galactoside ABC-type transport system permease subunit
MTMDVFSLFGLFAVTAMLVAYALEERSHWFVLAFAGACALGSIYGFLQGACWSRRSGPASRCGAG